MKRGSGPVLIVMGVSGVGKTTIAQALNAHLHWPMQEGDALHPPSNIQKLHAGIPLTDADRAPWLMAVKHWIDARLAHSQPGLITCSALKRAYRARLIAGRPNVRPLYLKADRAVIEARLARRTGHFMDPALLGSQVDTLQEPGPDERPITVNAEGTVAATVRHILAALGTDS